MTQTTITMTTLAGNLIDVDPRDVPGVLVELAAGLDLDRRDALNAILYHDGCAVLCTHIVMAHNASRHLPHTPAERESRSEIISLIDAYRAVMREQTKSATGA